LTRALQGPRNVEAEFIISSIPSTRTLSTEAASCEEREERLQPYLIETLSPD